MHSENIVVYSYSIFNIDTRHVKSGHYFMKVRPRLNKVAANTVKDSNNVGAFRWRLLNFTVIGYNFQMKFQ